MIRLAFSVSLAACFVSVPARADPPVAQPVSTARLEYTRGPGAERCPGEQDLRDAVGVRLGRDPFTPHALHRFVVRLSGFGSELYADLSLFDAAGRDRGSGRFLESSGDCARLIAAIALRTSIALAPLRAPQADSQPIAKELRTPAVGATVSLQPRSSAPLPAPPPPPASMPPSSPPVASTPWRFEVSVQGGVDAGNTPNTTGGLAAGIALGKGPWSIGLEARGYFPTSIDGSDGASAAVSLITGAVMPCGRTDGPWALFGCVVLSVGALRTEGAGVDVPEEDSAAYVGLGLRAGLDISLSDRFALRFQGDAMYAPVTRDIELAGEVVWTTSSSLNPPSCSRTQPAARIRTPQRRCGSNSS